MGILKRGSCPLAALAGSTMESGGIRQRRAYWCRLPHVTMLLGRASSEERQRRFREIMACRPTPEPATKGGIGNQSVMDNWSGVGRWLPPFVVGSGVEDDIPTVVF